MLVVWAWCWCDALLLFFGVWGVQVLVYVVVAAYVILLHVSTRLAHTSSYAYTNTNTYDINMHMRIAHIRDLAACEDTCILLLLL